MMIRSTDEQSAILRVVSQLPGAVVLLSSQELRVKYASKAYREYLPDAFKDRDLIGVRFADYVKGGEDNPSFQALKSISETGRGKEITDYRITNREGKEFWVDWIGSPMENCTDRWDVLLQVRDITNRKLSEKALEESENRLRLAQQAARIGTFEWDIQTNDDKWTPELEAMYGLLPGGFPGREEAWEAMVHPDDRERVLHQIDEAMRTGSLEAEWRVVWPDGSIHWNYGRARVFKDADGEPLRMLGVNIDITERKRAEEVLKDNERLYRALFDNTEDGFVLVEPIFDKNGTVSDLRYIRANRTFEKQTGLRADVFVGHKLSEVLPNIEPRWLGVHDEAVRSGRQARYEDYNADTGRWYDVLVFPYSKGLLGEQFRDITERKRAEEVLRKSEEKFAKAFYGNTANMLLAMVDDGRIIDVNDTLLDLIGYSRGDLIGGSINELNIWKDTHQRDDFIRDLRKDGLVRNREVEIVRKNDKKGVALLSGYLMTVDGEELMLNSSVDITDLKEAEKKLEEAKTRAEFYLDLLTHDITNYHTAAIGYLDIAQMRLDLNEKEEKLISRPLQVLKSSSELIANVRDLRRVETGQDRRESVDLCHMLEEVKEAFEDPPGRDITFILNLEDRCSVVISSLLRDAFANIVSNAIKHSSGPVTISISLRRVQQDGRDLVRIDIEDTGPGIADERKEKIFDRGITGLTKGVSRGLGLYLVKRLVEEHDGQVWVENRVSGDSTKGARFIVLLPSNPPQKVSHLPAP